MVLGDVGVMHRCLMVTGHTAPAGQLRLIDGVVILRDGREVVAGAAGRAGVWRAAAVPSHVPTVRNGQYGPLKSRGMRSRVCADGGGHRYFVLRRVRADTAAIEHSRPGAPGGGNR